MISQRPKALKQFMQTCFNNSETLSEKEYYQENI